MAEYNFDVIKLSYCQKHKMYWVTNCPDCMADDYEQQGIQKGRREVVEWIENRSKAGYPSKFIPSDIWQYQLKEWGL